ncbi:hypothetical protein B0H19DRAFT_390097 [Mycena capillaripes]|nr:hypothetical protein B0H19DRAFT_390097 [Mycena capillaripes]
MASRPYAFLSTGQLALKRYEKHAAEEREAMAFQNGILPGCEPPSANLWTPSPPVLLSDSASQSQILPTDLEALKSPSKTLETPSVTGIVAVIPTADRNELRAEDAAYCAKHFGGHVVLSQLNQVLTRLGTSVLVDKFTHCEKVARAGLESNFTENVLSCFTLESVSTSKSIERVINNKYWLSALADVCFIPFHILHTADPDELAQAADPEADDSQLAVDYFPTPGEKLPEQKQHGYKKNRKYDASLRPCAAESSSIFNIFVNIEFTKTEAPNVGSNPLIGASQNVAKYQQAITNADDLLTFQSTRLYVPTLSFHGKGSKTKLFFSILSQERLEFAVVADCFSTAKFPTVSALLNVLRTTSLYQLGYNPLFLYKLTSSELFSLGDVVPASVILPEAPGAVTLSELRLSSLRSTPFQRSTVVFKGQLNES